MNKIYIIGVALTLFIIGFFSIIEISHASVTTGQDINKLSKMNIYISHPTLPAKIDQEVALENAKSAFKEWSNDSTNTTIEYQIMTNESFNGFSPEALEKNPKLGKSHKIENLPVYIISFKGMSYTASTPIGYKGTPFIHHEYNVVVDATTGVPLFGYSYR